MIMDNLTKFCQDEAAFGTAATRLEGSQIDLGVAARSVGMGTPVYVIIVVEVAFSGGTSVNFIVASDATAAVATDGSASVHGQTGAIAVADLTLGKRFVIPLTTGVEYEQFLGLLVTTVGTTTVGSITAFISPDPLSTWKAYADGTS